MVIRKCLLAVIGMGIAMAACAADKGAAPANIYGVKEPAIALEAKDRSLVADLAKRMSKDRRVIYSGRIQSYRFYVGGDLDARYTPAKKVIEVDDLAGGGSCQFNTQGALLIGDAKGRKAQEALKTQCDAVLQRLGGYFSS